MLVGSFQVDIRRDLQALSLAQDTGVGYTGVEPYVKRIGYLVVTVRFLSQQISRVQFKPGINAGLLHALRHLLHQARCVRVKLTAFFMNKQGDGYAPGALPGNTPVRAAGQHAINARLAPLGQPFHLLNRLQGFIQQAILAHTHKPLGCGSKDYGALVAPAVGVGMLILLAVQQHAALLQQLNDTGVGFQYVLTGKILRVRQIHTIATDRVVDVQFILLPHDKIVLAMGRGGMHSAGSRFGSDMVTQDYRHLPRQEAVLQQLVFQGRTLAATQYLEAIQAVAPSTGFSQFFGQHQSPALPFYQHVIQPGMQTDRHIGRQGPGRSGPDGYGNLPLVITTAGGIDRRGVYRSEGDIYRRRQLVLVLHFGLGQG